MKKEVFGILMLSLFTSCVSEEPFKDVVSESGAEVSLNLSLNSGITRADNSVLFSSCKISLTGDHDVNYQWTGTQNMPSKLYLRYGNYNAMVEAGDSLAASFDKKFYKGHTEFEIGKNNLRTQVNILCKIANYVVSLDLSNFPADLRDELEITFSSSTGSLKFTKSNMYDKGYFMRWFNHNEGTYDNTLTYTVKGKDLDGSEFTKSGEILNIQPAHEYQLVVEKNRKEESPQGGAFIQLEVKDYELLSEDAGIFGIPEFKWENVDLAIDEQIYEENTFENDYSLSLSAYKGFKSLILRTEDEKITELFGASTLQLTDISEEELQSLENSGLNITKIENSNNVTSYSITFSNVWLNSLGNSDKEYKIGIVSVDGRGLSNSMEIRIANTEAAMDAPFKLMPEYWEEDLLSIRAFSANVKYKLFKDDISNLKLQYRKAGSEEGWKEKDMTEVRKGENVIKLEELEQNTQYEVRIAGGDMDGDSYKFMTKNPAIFTTEEVFQIPNAGMEDWSYNGIILEPFGANLNDDQAFWDTGNHGALSMGQVAGAENLTTQNFDVKNFGNSSAALKSKYISIRLGAGNIFSGKFIKTTGSGLIKMNGLIEFGRKYNNTHPSKLKVRVNYQPQLASSGKGADSKYIPSGSKDKGQIYVALTTEIHSADTNDPSTLVDPNNLPDYFLAFGEKTFDDNIGENNMMEEIIIPFNYNWSDEMFQNAKTQIPQFIIIVCSASKYGDYFSGADGSIMYVDDFELIYE